MTTPTGQISLGNVRDEFGPVSGQVRLGQYRVNQLIAGREWGLDDGVQRNSGIKDSISLGQLRGKTLNVVVDYIPNTSPGQAPNNFSFVSDDIYNSYGIPVGGFIALPSSSSNRTKKVYHVIRSNIGSYSTVTSIYPRRPSNVSNPFGGNRPITSFGKYSTVSYITDLGTKTVTNIFGKTITVKRTPQEAQYSKTNTTYSGNLSVSGGSGTGFIISITKTVTETGVPDINRLRVTTITTYTPTIVHGGYNYFRFDRFSVDWDGIPFKFEAWETNSLNSAASLRTGSSWNQATLIYIITKDGKIYGRGGCGGRGGNNNSNLTSIPEYNDQYYALSGENGGNAFHAEYNCTVIVEPQGIIAGGGGGGGGGSFTYTGDGDGRLHGGGGGGGAGLPVGKGGAATNLQVPGYYYTPNLYAYYPMRDYAFNSNEEFLSVVDTSRPNNQPGDNGSDGTLSYGGIGGLGGIWKDGAGGGDRISRKGGDGGNLGQPGAKNNIYTGRASGNGGSAGSAIIKNGGVSVNLINNGSVYGSY